MSDRVPVYYPTLDAVHQQASGRGHNSAKEASTTVPFEAIYSVQDDDYVHKGGLLDGIRVPDAPLPCSMKKSSMSTVASDNVPLIHLPSQDDEMLAWLQFYPTEDSFDKKYCSEQSFGHSLDSTWTHHRSGGWRQSEHLQSYGSQPHKDIQYTAERSAFGRDSACDLRQISAPHTSHIATDSHGSAGSSCGRENSISRAFSGPSVLERRDSVLEQRDSQTLCSPSSLGKNNSQILYSSCVFEPRVSQALSSPSVLEQYDSQNSPGSSLLQQTNAVNFSMFSRPLASARSSLNMLVNSSKLDQVNAVVTKNNNNNNNNNNNARQASVEGPDSFGSSTVGKLSELHGHQGLASAVESTASLNKFSSPVESKSNLWGKNIRNGNAGTGPKDKNMSPILVVRNDRNADIEKLEADPRTESLPIAATSDTQDIVATVTSASGNDETSASRHCSNEKSAQEMDISSCKRKSHHAGDFECDSKDVEEKGTKEKHQLNAKRARAAEIHNQSERRRRNKINDRMKALQELIPHANKTDKASMLDEAIEYIKTLQTQLQWMCMRSGVAVPPSMIPSNTQYPMVQQLNMGMGHSFGTTVSGNMLDNYNMAVSVTSPFVTVPTFIGQPIAGSLSHLSVCQPAVLPSTSYNSQRHTEVPVHQNLLINSQLEQSSFNVPPNRELPNTAMQSHSTHRGSMHNKPK